MHGRIIVVGLSCAAALTVASKYSPHQPLNGPNLVVIPAPPPDSLGPGPAPQPKSPSDYQWLQDLQDTVNGWDDPFHSIGGLALSLVRLVLTLIPIAICLAIAFIGFAVAVGVIGAVYTGVSKNPALYRTAGSAGLGAGFGLLLFNAVEDLCDDGWHKAANDLIAIAIVSIGVVIFIEPLEEWFGDKIGSQDADSHSHAHANRAAQRWYLRLAAVGIFAAVSLSHGLLHEKIDKNITEALCVLAAALLIPAVTTYAWIRGSLLPKPRSAVLGAITGAAAGAGGWVLALLIQDVAGLTDAAKVSTTIINALQWGAAGFFGGLAIDARWRSTPARGAGVAVVIVFGVAGLLAHVSWGADWSDLYLDIGKALGWAGGLIAVERSASVAFGGSQPSTLAPQ
jgi:hypothetical protein